MEKESKQKFPMGEEAHPCLVKLGIVNHWDECMCTECTPYTYWEAELEPKDSDSKKFEGI